MCSSPSPKLLLTRITNDCNVSTISIEWLFRVEATLMASRDALRSSLKFCGSAENNLALMQSQLLLFNIRGFLPQSSIPDRFARRDRQHGRALTRRVGTCQKAFDVLLNQPFIGICFCFEFDFQCFVQLI